MFEIRTYLTQDGHDPFSYWHDTIKDHRTKMAIDRRIIRVMENGNFGDHKHCRDGVWELRVDIGPGWRVYYALTDQTTILLLCGGNKHSQQPDIDRACDYWKDWRRRHA